MIVKLVVSLNMHQKVGKLHLDICKQTIRLKRFSFNAAVYAEYGSFFPFLQKGNL